MRARLKDVAELAGVATNTASTILNRRPNSWASKETAERVFKAAEQLGYTPSRAALGLRLGSFRTVGLVIPDLHNPVYTTFADLLEQRMRAAGYDLILEHSRTDLEHEKHCLESILERQIDAVTYFVSSLARHAEFLELAARAGKPIVALTGPPQAGVPFPSDAVEIDFAPGVCAAIDHLHGLGHRRFAFLCALAKGHTGGERPEYFSRRLVEKGVAAADTHFVTCAHDLPGARAAFGSFLGGLVPSTRPTALIAMNDLSAIGAIRAAYDLGLRVPEDLSVIGVDNIPLGEHLHRRLTTIAQPLEKLADATAEMLLHRINETGERTPPAVRRFEASLLVKETTARAPGSGV
jgi:LacI family transcriptional regulator